MATVTKSRRVPAYCPTPAEIAAATAEIRAKHRAMLEAGVVPPEPETLVVKTPEQAAAATAKEREYHRDWLRKRRAAARAERDAADANLSLQQNDQTEPIDLDEYRDPRQVEEWLPVPTTEAEPAPERKLQRWEMTPEQRRREDIQSVWDDRRERRRLAEDADRRGVLNYYNINRSPRNQAKGIEWDEQEMLPRDIANVELLEFGAVDEMLGMIIDAAESQHEMEDLNCRWGLGDVDPETMPVRTVREREPRDVVAFRSKRK